MQMDSSFVGLAYLTSRAAAGQIGFEAALAMPTHVDTHALIAHCQPRLDARGFLPRSAIVPREIVPLLPHLFIAEPAGASWRYRLVGTVVAARLGLDFTGKTLEQLYRPETVAATQRHYDALIREPRITTLRGRYLGLEIDHAELEFVHIPMLARDGRTPWIFGGVFFLDLAPRRHSFFE